MKPKKIWANYAVTNVERTRKFYTALGFNPNTGQNDEIASFLIGDNDFVIHFFLKERIEANTNVRFSDLRDGNEILFTLAAESNDEVDDCAEEVRNAGGSVISNPAAFGEGYYGFVFSDPDGHKFNVFYM